MSTTTNNIQVPRSGDLAIIPDGDGFILGLFNDPREVTYGDVTRPVEPESCFVLRAECVNPEAGKYVGMRFGTTKEINAKLWPLRTGAPNVGSRVPVAPVPA